MSWDWKPKNSGRAEEYGWFNIPASIMKFSRLYALIRSLLICRTNPNMLVVELFSWICHTISSDWNCAAESEENVYSYEQGITFFPHKLLTRKSHNFPWWGKKTSIPIEAKEIIKLKTEKLLSLEILLFIFEHDMYKVIEWIHDML